MDKLNVRIVTQMNPAAAIAIGKQLQALGEAGQCAGIGYDSLIGENVAYPVRSEKAIRFLTQTKTGEPRDRPWVSQSAFPADERRPQVTTGPKGKRGKGGSDSPF